MSLSSISIRRPVFAWMLMAALILFGILSLKKMGVGLLPDVDFPQVNIRASYPGASPELMESDVTETLEGALVGVEGVRLITSSSRFGSANITLEFNLDRNIDAAIQDVQTAVQSAMRRLPDDIELPTVSKSNPEDRPILWIGLSGGESLRELMLFARNQLQDRFASVAGVGEIILGGSIDPQVRVWLDPKKLLQYELTADDIIRSIQEEHTEKPVGYVVQGVKEINLRIMGETLSAEELANIPITRRGGSPLFEKLQIKDVGRVEMGLDDVRRISRVGGKRAVGIGIKKQRGVNTLAVAKAVKQRMKEVQLPEGYQMQVNFDSTLQIEDSVHELLFTLLLSILLTGFVCWLFLGNIGTTINVLFAIPTSLLGTFLVIHFLGYTLNSFTMLAIILVVGIVVDDTIMILENIVRFREEGHSWRDAALKGTEQITGAAIAATLAIIAIFLPATLVEGTTGAYLRQFGVTLSVAVAISLLEALTFTPMRLSLSKRDPKMSGVPARMEHFIKKLAIRYGAFIEKSFKRPAWVYFITLAIFISSMSFIKILPKEFLPATNGNVLFARVELPQGTSLGETARRFEDLERIFENNPDIEKVYSIIGGFTGTGNQGNLFVTLKDVSKRSKELKEVENDLRAEIKKLGKDFQVRLQGSASQGFGGRRGYPIEFNLYGPDWETLVEGSRKLVKAMGEDPNFTDIDTSYEEGAPEFSIKPKRNAALARGVSVDELSTTLNFLYQGQDVARFNDTGRRSEIVVQADKEKIPSDIEGVKNLYVRNNRGNLVKMGDVVEVTERVSAASITRENRVRNIGVYSNVSTSSSQDKASKRLLALAKEVLPPEVTIQQTGSSEEMSKTLISMTLAILLGIIVAYMVLGSQYNSWIHPITILLALPFSITGAWIALYVGGSSINFYSMIGLLLLMGLVKKNSIMLVELANQLRHENKMEVHAAAVEAGKTRLRPILMTSFATIAAALPPAIGLGASSSATQPMSLVIVGGVLFSACLTLFVVPLAYVHMSRLEKYVDPTQ
ncbi:MAG: efflux RND transporter permease subunit [Bdellovibrionota bacterium]